MADSYSPNKNIILMQTGNDVGTWGSLLNADALSVIDNNLGGNTTVSLTSLTTLTLTSAQVENIYISFTGTLTGNCVVTWPSGAGFYIINNSTTGSYTLTVQPSTGSGGLVIAQNSSAFVFISTNLGTATYIGVPSVSPSFTGTISGVNETLSGTLGVTGAATLSSTLNVTDNTSLGGTLSVTGHTTLEGVTSTGATGTGNLVFSASPTGTGTATWPTIAATTAMTLNGSPVIDKINIQTFGTSGTYTPTTGMRFCIVEMVGGGGGGGNGSAGGGGGAGGYLLGFYSASSIGSSQFITIGAGGTGGNAGQITSFGSLMQVAGGQSSSFGFTNGVTALSNGGLGGNSSSGGQILCGGQQGGYGFENSISSTKAAASGFGGSTRFGGGGLPVLSSGTLTNGNAATGYGCGGSGALYGGTGGSGSAGLVIITEFISA